MKARVKSNTVNTRHYVYRALKAIGENGFDGVTLRAKSTSIALEQLGVIPTDTPATVRHRIMQELRRQALITETRPDPTTLTLQLTVHGIHRLQRLELDTLSIATPDEWDGIWRMVTFDIPARRHESRYIMTSQLRRLGFVLLQNSIWLHPYPCFAHVETIVTYANLAQYVSLAELRRLDPLSEKRMLRHFPELKYSR